MVLALPALRMDRKANVVTMTVHVALYHTRLFSTGLDDARSFGDYDTALKWARAELKRTRSGQATITEYGHLKASVSYSKGRLLTRKAK
jgi:hypothetical protein